MFSVAVHASLCYAELLLARAMLAFIQDEGLIAFLKGALRVREAYNCFKYYFNYYYIMLFS